jgi:hypothetical protein
MYSSYGAPRVKPYCHFFWNYESSPASGRTGDALMFRVSIGLLPRRPQTARIVSICDIRTF